MVTKILIIGEGKVVDEIERQLAQDQFEVLGLKSFFSIQPFQELSPDLVILVPCHPDAFDNFKKAKQIRLKHQYLPIIMVTNQSSEELAISALRSGVNDYFKWPISPVELISSINRNLPVSAWNGFLTDYSGSVVFGENHPFVGQSSAITELKSCTLKAAMVDSNVLITGETGTGKELVAGLIHRHSLRRDKAFVCINCAALPDSLLESELFGYEKGAFTGAHTGYEGKLKVANGGTVLFDEIGDMSPSAQAKILRAIESKKICPLGSNREVSVDFRIIAATNQDLKTSVIGQQFRKDLYFRLNVIHIQLPPLKERKDDIPLLLNHYLQTLSGQFGHHVIGFQAGALDCLMRYEWPGNVRELRNLVEVLLVQHAGGWISRSDLPQTFRGSNGETLPTERELILSTLKSTRWNKSMAAQQLNWSRMTLYRKMTKYGIQESERQDNL